MPKIDTILLTPELLKEIYNALKQQNYQGAFTVADEGDSLIIRDTDNFLLVIIKK